MTRTHGRAAFRCLSSAKRPQVICETSQSELRKGKWKSAVTHALPPLAPLGGLRPRTAHALAVADRLARRLHVETAHSSVSPEAVDPLRCSSEGRSRGSGLTLTLTPARCPSRFFFFFLAKSLVCGSSVVVSTSCVSSLHAIS